MRNFDRIRAHKPEGIESKRAYIIGGGIAGLASAVFLINDGYMNGKNVTIYEQLSDVGGSMDGASNKQGYTSRGERELEPNMECLWYLCSIIPSLTEPGRTVLEETVEANKEYKIYSNKRVLYKQGQNYEKISDFKMSPKLQAKMIEMMTVPEEKVENVSIDEFFGDTAEELYQSSMWICFHSMLAFKHYHSLIEMKRYMLRFVHHLPGIEHLRGQIELKWNQYDALIKPIKVWLEEKGVKMVTNCTVYDLDMDEKANMVTGIKAKINGEESYIKVLESDIVITTLGSMTQNSCMGDNKTIAKTNRDQEHRGLFTVWENLAKKDEKFGHPEKFINDIDKTKWMSVFPTTKGYPEFHKRMRKLLNSKEGGSSGAVTILDSNWEISFVLYGKYFPNQAEDEQVFWFDGLYGECPGNYIKKPMAECTGEEILTEFLYHLGMLDIKDEVLKHTYVSTCMMPYITSQFMPRAIKDRPNVIPNGCTNLALIGQYVELPGDVVFTVETSVRTAMMAAYGLLKLDRPVAPLYTPHYDIRIITMCLKKMLGSDEIKKSDLPQINPLKANSEIQKLLDAINTIPAVSDDEIIYQRRKFMKIYDLKYNAKAPEGIEKRKAYIIGGGIAGLSAAVYLVDDIHMPGKNITILEKGAEFGGSMDGTIGKEGYICRGERELEPYMECLWNILSKVPSLTNEGRTVLDDVHDYNYEHPLHNQYRLVVQGKAIDCHDFSMDEGCMKAMTYILFCSEKELEGKSIADVFPESFFHSTLWATFHNMLAFKPTHSAMEAKRYFKRFTHFMPESDYEHGIIHTELNEYDAIILPIIKFLESKGVNFQRGIDVKEIVMTDDNNTATAIKFMNNGQEKAIDVSKDDMVFFTNGSMVENCAFGDNKTVAPTNRDTKERGLFTVWEKLAKKDEKFGHPEKFLSNIDMTKWISFFLTIKDYPEFYKRIEGNSARPIGTNGIISFPESNWDLSLICYHSPYFPDQPKNWQVGWAYGLFADTSGNYIKKPMSQCTGEEILTELLFHLGILDIKDEMLEHTYVSTCMMPYITSQFMVRDIADRPTVVPQGCTNIAFIGQFVETPSDAVFTVETSVRTGMYAAYALSGVEKKSIETAPTFYDLRYIKGQLMKIMNKEGDITSKDLPKINPLKIKDTEKEILTLINDIEPYPSIYPGKDSPSKS